MPDPQVQGSLREAARELHRYLSGELAPLMVIDTAEEFLAQPPDRAASAIGDWIQAQASGPAREIPMSDLVFHALKKLHILAEFKLVPEEPLMQLINVLSRLLVQICPEDERVDLKLRLSRLGEADAATALSPGVQYLHRAGGAGPIRGRGNDAAREAPRDIRRLSLLIDRLEKLGPREGAPRGGGADRDLLARILSTAALGANTGEELDSHLARIREHGLSAQLGQVFRTLGWGLSGWSLPAQIPGQMVPATASQPVEAMRRIVSLAPDSHEAANRLGEMIYAAIEQFNEGRLPQAVAILGAASSLVAEKKPDPALVKTMLGQAERTLAEPAMRGYADAADKHPLLRNVLEFFPGYRPAGLVDRVCHEDKREARKLLLDLLECHGANARQAIFERLEACLHGGYPDEHAYHRRNMVFLLRRTPRPDDEPPDREITLLREAISSGEPLVSVKEAIGELGQLRETLAEQVLIDRLRGLEHDLVGGNEAPGEEAWDLLDRLCASLAIHGTPAAIRTVAAHAFNRAPALGPSLSRISHLSRANLSADPEQLAILIGAIRSLLPGKVLGFVMKRGNYDLVHMMRAVSGTPTDEVRGVLREIATRFGKHAIGDEAEKALARLEPRSKPAKAPAKTLTGDLELFALPSLLQSLADSQATGELILFDPRQARQAMMRFAQGRVAHCEAGRLGGAAAVYEVFEKLAPGTFVFRSSGEAGAPAAREGESMEVMPLVLEGVRRHDEYKEARVLVPDGQAFEPGDAAPETPEDESDPDFVKAVWTQASARRPADACEASIASDAYRVRSLYARWLEQGALRPVAAAAVH